MAAIPNVVKYSTSSIANATLVGSVAFGWVGNAYGPSETTGWYAGINVPSGSYAVYATSASQIVSVTFANNDSDLILVGKQLTGQNFTSSAQAQTWLNANGYAVATQVYSSSADMLRANLVAADTSSYDAAAVNSWISIASQSYVNLRTNISGTLKYGNTDAQVATRAATTGYPTMSFGSGSASTPLTISTGQYLYAFVAESWNTNGEVKVGYTSTFHTGSPTYFPYSASVIGGTRSYFVRKQPSGVELAPATQNLYPVIAMSVSPNATGGDGFGWFYNAGTWGQAPLNATMKHQFLVTSTQQW